MPSWLLITLFCIAVAWVLGFLHLRFWTWWYRVPFHQDELRFAETKDGWRIALARRAPRGDAPRRPPVLLCHGLSANRGNLDFGVERYSLAHTLALAGFECFTIDLRGHGDSRRFRDDAPRRWDFDTYLEEDLPAAFAEIEKATGSSRILWVGHSQGALLGLAAAGLYPDRIAAVAALASPTHFHLHHELRRWAKLDFLASGRGHKFWARLLAPIAGYFHPRFAQIAINTRNIETRLYRQLLVTVIEDASPPVMRQMKRWVREDAFRSRDGKIDYRANLAACRQPALFVAGVVDHLAPADAVQATYDAWAGAKTFKIAGRAYGQSADYGHSDMVFGLRAPEEVFPWVQDFLLAHSEPQKKTEAAR
jgi:pimeloyl-ACP methyl ester carboxylesterase